MKTYKKIFLYSSIFTSNKLASLLIKKIIFFILGNRKQSKGKNNICCFNGVMLNCRIKIKGDNNNITISPYGVAKGMRIEVYGDNNIIQIGEKTNLTSTLLSCFDNGNKIMIGRSGNIGKSNITSMEGKEIHIGNGSLISYDVEIRTSDGHSIYDYEGNRVNKAKDVFIDDNVWIGQKCLIFKGSFVPVDSVIGANSFVNKKLVNEESVYVGNPVYKLKTGIKWSKER